jgi:hypothetical protein
VSGSPRIPQSCAERGKTAQLVALRLSDELEAADARLLRRHLSACRSCFEESVAADPTLLFARLAASVEAAEAPLRAVRVGGRGTREEGRDASALVADVLAALRIRAAEEGRRASPRVRAAARPWLKAAAAVALASGVAALFALRRPPMPADPGVLAVVASDAFARPPIEELGSPGARIYQFAGSDQGEPTVVFVANPNADL